MKKYNLLMGIFLICYLILAVCIWRLWQWDIKERKDYRVEINRVMAEAEMSEKLIKEWNKKKYEFITNISFLPAEEKKNKKIDIFYEEKEHYVIHPVFSNNKLLGYARFDYKVKNKYSKKIFLIEGLFFLFFLLLLLFFMYIRNNLIKPFFRLTDMPYELAKGHFQQLNYESKNKFFGKFLWGIGMLQDTLKDSKNNSLRLEKEKKLLLLSLSHDIKTPLNAIKLYAKALEEHLYSEDEEKAMIGQISEKVLDIEQFVGQIVKSSTEDILHIDVEIGEFYLKDLIDKIGSIYETKCQLMMTKFYVDDYENRLFTGDMERMTEVFENLLENGLKYGDGKEIHVSFYEEDYRQLICVFNTGSVVTGQEFVHLFDSFFRGNNTEGKEGNGLGLYICRQIMKKMNGDIFAECREKGMAFIIVMPNRVIK